MPKRKTEQQPDQALRRLEWIGSHFDAFQRNGRGWKARCPLHDDHTPSLSINTGEDGRVLVQCFNKCPTAALLDVVGLRLADLMPNARYIVAAYDYRDEAGVLLFQAVRYEPKDCRQRRPKEGGGWDWSIKGVRRVLYRLPELMAADAKLPVYIPEGEKDVDRLHALGLVATTNVGGAAAPWLPEYNDALRGRQVVLLPDNDPAGWERVNKLARELVGVAAAVKVVELPGLPDKGDVSDWLAAGGTRNQLAALATAAPNAPNAQQDNTTPQPLGDNPTGQHKTQQVHPLSCGVLGALGGVVQPYPLDALPHGLRQFVEAVAAALPCPPDFAGAMALPVLATLVGRKRCIAPKPGWTEYPTLWISCVARSGDRKTPALQAVLEPLHKLQRRLLAEYQAEMVRFDNEEIDEEPRLRQLLTTDTTIEALKDVLEANPSGIIYPADELSGWARSMSQYKGGKGDDRQLWLSIWSGMPVVVNRKSTGCLFIPDPFVSVTGGIQPAALGDLIDDGREDGFAARLLFSYPDPVPSNGWTEENIGAAAIGYNGICESLFDLEPQPQPLQLGKAAKRLWVEWVNAHRAEEPPDNLRPTWAKAEGHCLRLALVLYCVRSVCNETKGGVLDGPSMAGAAALIEYFKSHARRVYSSVTMHSDTGRIGSALRWIRRHGGTVTARLANMNGVTKDSNAAKDLFNDLAELGYGTVTCEQRGSVVFRLHSTPQPNAPTGQQEEGV